MQTLVRTHSGSAYLVDQADSGTLMSRLSEAPIIGAEDVVLNGTAVEMETPIEIGRGMCWRIVGERGLFHSSPVVCVSPLP